MSFPEINQPESFVVIRASCNNCGWSGQTSFRSGDPHPEQMFASAASDLQQMHNDESQGCTARVTLSR